MTPIRLNEIVKNPLSVSEKEIEVLETLTLEFPYFNLPYILLAKVYKENQSYKFNQQIKRASLRSIDRQWLFDFINGEKAGLEQMPQATENSIVSPEEKPSSLENHTLELVEDTIEEEITNQDVLNETQVLSLTQNEEIEAQEIENTPIEENTKEESPEIPEIKEEIILPSEPEIREEKEVEIHPFTKWLSQFSQQQIKEVKPKNILPETPKPVSIKRNPPPPTSETSSTESQQIIDAFLKNNPSISHPKTEFFKAEKAALKSLELPDDIITESLASIYVKQGHKEQAIYAYEKLSLKFPQKETYFATLIKDLKNND